MPLVRVEVRNEYAFGAPELYREANKEEPKEVLEGVAVAGLVGVLRQLGDLAEFAAEVFHGLQEEVMRTSSRSHTLIARVQLIETAVSPLEKALLAQRSHLHFAYTAGSNWHARIPCEQNHFVYSDVPQFIMDSYDDSRDPPRLHLLDRFDPGGPGSCLKRYSDPTFFRKASAASDEATADRTSKDKKGRKIKKRRSWTRSREVSRDASFSFNSGRMQFTQTNVYERSSSSQSASTYDATKRSDFVEQSTSDLRNGSSYTEGDFHPFKSVLPQEQEYIESGSGYIEGDFHSINSVQPQEQEPTEFISSSVKSLESDFLDYHFLGGKFADAYDDIQIYPSQEKAGCSSSSVTWDEKNEKVLEPKTHDSDNDDITQDNDHNRHLESFSPDNAVDFLIVDKMDIQPCDQTVPAPESHLGDIESETDHFMDALNTIESECETDTDYTKKQDVEHFPKLEITKHDLECSSSSSESNVLPDSSTINGNCGNNLISLSPKSLHATSSNEDEYNPIFLVDKDSQSSHRAEGSSTPGSPQSVDSHNSDNTNAGNKGVEERVYEITRHDLECSSSSSESNVLPDSSTINGNCGNNLVSLSPKSLHATSSNQDEYNSIFLVDKDSQSSQRAEESLTPGSPQRVDSHGSDNTNADISPGMPITDGISMSLESQKNVPETSNVTSVTFWTNGGLLGLQPSKPPDCSILNAPPPPPPHQELAHMNDWEISSSTRHADQMKNLKHIEEDLNTDSSTCHEHQENGTSFRKTLWKIPPADLDVKLGKLGDSVHQKLLPGGDQNANRTISGRNKYLFGDESPKLSPSSSPPLAHMKMSFQPTDGFETCKLKLKFPYGNTDSENGSDVFPSFQLVPEVFVTRHNVGLDSDGDTFYKSSPCLSDGSHSNGSESNSEQWESSESPTSKDRDFYDALREISLTEPVSTVPENGLKFLFVENDIPNLPSTISQPKPAPFSEDRIDTTNVQERKSGIWKSNGQGESNQDKSIDEKEDLLHQIRTKSFNLRPTVTTKPTVPSGGSAYVQVTAILEKANAIRQAVGSDGEDDGNWSEA